MVQKSQKAIQTKRFAKIQNSFYNKMKNRSKIIINRVRVEFVKQVQNGHVAKKKTFNI